MNKSSSGPKKRSLPKSQEQRLEIFKELKGVLSKCFPPLTSVSDFEGRYELVSKKLLNL